MHDYPSKCTRSSHLHEVGTVTVSAIYRFFSSFGAYSPQWDMASSFTRFLDHIWRTIVGRTPLDEWSARSRELYLTTHNTRNRQTDRQTSIPPVGFDPTIPASERPQTYALDRAATGTVAIYRLPWLTSPSSQIISDYHESGHKTHSL